MATESGSKKTAKKKTRKSFKDLYHGKYFSVFFNVLFFVLPVSATALASIASLQESHTTRTTLIIVSIILAAVGAGLAALQKRYSKEQQVGADSADAAYAAIVDAIRHSGKLLAQRLDISEDSHARVTIYASAKDVKSGKGILCPIARFSFNENLDAPGRPYCPSNQGVLAQVWEGKDNGKVVASFPPELETRKKRYEDYNMDQATVNGLTMYPTSMLGLRLEHDSMMVGALMFETDNPDSNRCFDATTIDSLDKDIASIALIDTIQSQLFAARNNILRLVHHSTFHDLPQVDTSTFTE